jgi:hypothetical protein
MKKIILYISILASGLSLSSCDDYLDVNTNPNQATQVDAQLLLPGAIVRAASHTVTYSNYGGQLAGYQSNAGGFSGFGSLINYNFTPGTNSNFEGAYDNLLDLKIVNDAAKTNPELGMFGAAAEIISVLEYHRIVDQHGNVPYSEALLGASNVTPKYDDAATIYQDLIKRLDAATAVIKAGTFTIGLNSSSDPLFGGDKDKWIKFANSLKLRLLVRISGVSALNSFTQQQFGSLENNFLTDDAIVNPGYAQDRPNPNWSSRGYTTAGAVANASRTPTFFSYGFYDGNKLADPDRGAVIYNDFGNTARPTPVNQLGIEAGNPAIRANYSPWYTGTFNSASSITNALGVMKGPTMGQPIFLLSELHFLLAEARLKGYLQGDYQASFESGLRAAFTYSFKTVTGTVDASKNVTTAITNYKDLNSTSYLVLIEQATSAAQRLEAIITQKYIAFNMIHGDEAWNDYRRTGYPVTVPRGTKYQDMASAASNATGPDRLPTILKYPQSEYDYNPSNVKDMNVFTDKLFWAK